MNLLAHPWFVPKTSKRVCTCDELDRPWPCPRRYAFSQCKRAHSRRLRLAIGFVVCLLGAVLMLSVAYAHDSWISRGGYRHPQTNEWCCGDNDCMEAILNDDSTITPVEGGFRVNAVFMLHGASKQGDTYQRFVEFVPSKEVITSRDGKYWRCKAPPSDRRRCFFVPPPST